MYQGGRGNFFYYNLCIYLESFTNERLSLSRLFFSNYLHIYIYILNCYFIFLLHLFLNADFKLKINHPPLVVVDQSARENHTRFGPVGFLCISRTILYAR